jgi:hypothetical protein
MASTTARVAAMVALLTAGGVARSDAAPDAESVVVLHVIDYAHVPAGEMAEAEEQATRVYHAAGVRTIWTAGVAASAAQADGAYHVDVVVLSKDMAARKIRADGVDEQQIFGTAVRPTRRAYIFYDHIAAYATQTSSPITRVLGVVLAHEVGHLLLPEFSHTSLGIMRATWEGRIARVPGFTDAQATRIRALLTSARRG